MHPIVRALVLTILIIIVGAVAFTYLSGSASWRFAHPDAGRPVGTSGAVDVDKARERGAEIGEKTAIATEKAREGVAEAAITAKIKAKMALDDSVRARAIDVRTSGSTVTLKGTVGSVAEHDRAVALARETAGVTNVVDQLAVR